ncbi:MAG: hypothetical protein V4649_03895 [Bacteroidota bacterium]
MAKARGIRLRVSYQRVEALHELCSEMLEEFVPVNDHHHLLREYMTELHDELSAMLQRKQHLYTLTLAGAATTAFYQLWHMLDIKHDKYACLVVDNLIKKMSSLAA